MLPVLPIGKLGRELLELALARPNQILALATLQPGDILGAHHPAVHHPDAMRFAVAALHRGDDLLHGRDVGAVAGEHLVAERDALARHHQTDANLLAISPMVTAVAAAGKCVAGGLALEVRARHVVQQQLVVEREQRSEALLEMDLQGFLVRQQAVESTVQPIVVDALRRHAQKVIQRRPTIPILGNMEFARRLA